MIVQRLNPADHFTLVQDREIRKSGLAGNYCALVVELAGVPDPVELRQYCTGFGERFPLAVAQLVQQGRQFAWQAGESGSLPFHEHSPDPGNANSAQQCLLDITGRPAAATHTAPFELHLIRTGNTSQLVLRWFHPAADAKGAELVLHYLLTAAQPLPVQTASPVERHLQQWGLLKKFRLAMRAVKNIRKLDRHSSLLPVQATAADAGGLALQVVRYSVAETAQIMALARENTGMTGTTLYLVGCMMRALAATGYSPDGDAYCVPYAVNLRRRKALAPVFGNQVSFLFAQADRHTAGTRQQLFAHLLAQNRAAIRQQLDHAMLPLMQAGSWLPAEKYGRIIRNAPDGRERSSFWFSYTGAVEPALDTVAGCQVTGMYQLSHMTSPPGLGLLASHFQGQLVLSYNSIRNRIPADWLQRLTQAMTTELLDRAAP